MCECAPAHVCVCVCDGVCIHMCMCVTVCACVNTYTYMIVCDMYMFLSSIQAIGQFTDSQSDAGQFANSVCMPDW